MLATAHGGLAQVFPKHFGPFHLGARAISIKCTWTLRKPAYNVGMSESHYVVMTVVCTRCKQAQDVHVLARGKVGQAVQETVICTACHKPFEVMLPDKIVSGEFLPG
jgi:hypothetical protein